MALRYDNKLPSSVGKQPPNTSANLPRALITGEPECAEMCFRKLMFSAKFKRFQQIGRVGSCMFVHIYTKFSKAGWGRENANKATQNIDFTVLQFD